MTLAIGDKVKVLTNIGSLRVGDTAAVVETNGKTYPYRLADPTRRDGVWVLTSEVEKIEEPKPEPKFKVGDRVRITNVKSAPAAYLGLEARVVAVTSRDAHLEAFGKRPNGHQGRFYWPLTGLTKVGVPFKLEVGDRVINRATGRKGVVFRAPISKALKVGDINPPIGEAALAIEVEEYEDRHPGTYDLIKKAPW